MQQFCSIIGGSKTSRAIFLSTGIAALVLLASADMTGCTRIEAKATGPSVGPIPVSVVKVRQGNALCGRTWLPQPPRAKIDNLAATFVIETRWIFVAAAWQLRAAVRICRSSGYLPDVSLEDNP
jgi:hypothetical protein